MTQEGHSWITFGWFTHPPDNNSGKPTALRPSNRYTRIPSILAAAYRVSAPHPAPGGAAPARGVRLLSQVTSSIHPVALRNSG